MEFDGDVQRRGPGLVREPGSTRFGLRSGQSKVAAIWAVWAAATLAVVAWSGESPVVQPFEARGTGPLWLLKGWDYGWYQLIAQHGYSDKSYAFFPLWPAILWTFGHVGAQSVLAVIAAIAFSAFAFLGVALSKPGGMMPRTAVALAAAPASFTLLLPYSDTLALALASFATAASARGRWAAAAVCGYLAAVARPNGVLVALLLAGAAWHARRRLPWIAALAPVLGFLTVFVYFRVQSGTWHAFQDAQEGFGRSGPTHLFASISTGWTVLQACIAVAAIVLVGFLWRYRNEYGGVAPAAFATAAIALPLLSGTVVAFSREALFAFPLVWLAADIPRPYAWMIGGCGVAMDVTAILLLPQYFP